MLVSGTGSTTTGIGTATAGSQELDKTAFMKLLVAQLRHQDPMEPMSNTEFVAQLAQFSGVEQLVSMNEGIEVLQLQQMGMSNAQAASFIGKKVEVRSDQLEVGELDTEVSAAFTLDGSADSVTANIRDASGAVVRKLELGPKEAGEITFEWDCKTDGGVKVPPGSYRIDIVASDASGGAVSWEARTTGVVTGVSYENGYPELLIGSIRAPLADVVNVSEV